MKKTRKRILMKNMKFALSRAGICILLTLLLLFCAGCSDDTPTVSTDIITFQNIPWNITADELLETYFPGRPYSEETANMDSRMRQLLSIEDLEVCGQNATVIFEFRSYVEEYFGLYRIYVLFPEGTNAEALRAELSSNYGEPIAYDRTLADHAVYWDGTETVDEYYLQAALTVMENPGTVPEGITGIPATRLHCLDHISYFLDGFGYIADDWVEKYPHDCAFLYEGHHIEFLQCTVAE